MEKENYYPKRRKKYPIKKLTRESFQTYKFYLKEMQLNAKDLKNNVEKIRELFLDDIKDSERARINHILLHVGELKYTIESLFTEVNRHRQVDIEPKKINRMKIDGTKDPNEFDEEDEGIINYKIIEDEE
jgi:hypothetical protein